MNDRCLIGIVTYNPSIERFTECIGSLSNQTDNLMIVDNGSSNVAEIERVIDSFSLKYNIQKNQTNEGIASGLSDIMEYAERNGYEWVLTIDQDSVIQSGLLDRYKKAVSLLPDVGMITCLVKDRNYTDIREEYQNKAIISIKTCITSGAFTSVRAYKETPGYDKSFFIDFVDNDLCYSIREAGYRIYRIKYLGLLHENGYGENRSFLGKKIVVLNKSADRVFYQVRNARKLYKKHIDYSVFQLMRFYILVLLKILLYENNKLNKIHMYIKGMIAR